VLDLPLPDDGVVPLTVIRLGGSSGSTFLASLSGLQDSSGTAVRGTLRVTPTSQGGISLAGLTAPAGIVQLLVSVTPVPEAGQITGSLSIAGDALRTWKLNLNRGFKPTATLVTDVRRIDRAIVCGWFWGCSGEQATATLGVFEKAGTWPLTGVGVRLESVVRSSGGFDVPAHVTAIMSGPAAKDGNSLWSLPEREVETRRVVRGGQGAVRLGLQNLTPGEYGAVLRFTAANSVADDAQKVELGVTVKHSVVWAGVVAVLGLFVSLVGTKGLATLRQYLEIRSRVDALNQSWLREGIPTSAVVWAQANLRLIREVALVSRFSIPARATAQLDSVAALVPVLKSLHAMRKRFDLPPEELNLPPFAVARARGIVERISRSCGDPPLDAAVASSVTAEIAALTGWLGGSKWEGPYWADLAPALRSVVHDVRDTDVSDPSGRQTIKALQDALRDHAKDGAPIPANPIDVERTYAALKVLWERRGAPEYADLVAAYNAGGTERMFEIADATAWVRLKEAVNGGRVFVAVSPAYAQAFEPFSLTVVPRDAAIGRTFLFRHRLEFAWRLESIVGETPSTVDRDRSARSRERKKGAFVLTPTTLQPSVSQYAPAAMTIKTSVELRWSNDPDPLKLAGPEVSASTSEAVGLFKSFDGLEYVSTAIVGGAAVLTGLSSLYYTAPAFGSPKDYVSLALWALAFDQAKNGLLQLGTASRPAAGS
jgi:hypothetical protein